MKNKNVGLYRDIRPFLFYYSSINLNKIIAQRIFNIYGLFLFLHFSLIKIQTVEYKAKSNK